MNYTVKVQTPTSLSEFILSHALPVSLPCGGCSRCGRCRITVSGNISPVSEAERKFLSKSDTENGIRLACFTTVYSECSLFLSDTDSLCHKADSVAIDLGTTTIEARYSDGSVFKAKNPQSAYGADIITRISSPYKKELHQCIYDCISNLINGCKSAVITGNTAMLSLLTGKSTDGIAKYPFIPESLFGYADQIDNVSVYYPHCASAFIGADILCGTVYEQLTSQNSPVMLCDVGTNTEIALWNGEKLFFASAPSGPAFEGGNISCGSAACSGAIYKVYTENKRITYDTVDSKPPVSVCGSALIDCAAVMLSAGIMDKTGRIMEYGHRFPNLISFRRGETAFEIGNSGVYITQSDIRALQAAKSAVSSAISILTRKAGLTKAPPIILAGNFGVNLNKENAVKTGLFPSTTFSTSPNCVLGGALMMNNEKYRLLAGKTASEAAVIELSLEDDFAEIFAKNMNF